MIAEAILACALHVSPVTMDRIIRVESGGNPLALNVNRLSGPQPRASTVQEAVAIASRYIAQGYSVDLGLAQLNSRNLKALNLTLEDAFDPCRNVAGGGAILSGFYGRAVQQFGEGQAALAAALSGYNTGSLSAGFLNGYVGKYYITANLPAAARPTAPHPVATPRQTVALNPYTASTGVSIGDLYAER